MKKIILFILLFLPIYVNAQITLVKDNFLQISAFMQYNNQLFFYAFDGTRQGLWKTDGTMEGTVFVKNIESSGIAFSGTEQPAVSGGLLYFCDNNRRLWRTDGTANGTIELTSTLVPFVFNKIDLNGTLIFAAGDGVDIELWRTDGTVTGTYRIIDLYEGSTSGILGPYNMAKQGNFIYFVGRSYNLSNGTLFRTDGTAAGTQTVPNAGMGINDLAMINDKIVFVSNIAYTFNCYGSNPTTGVPASQKRIMKIENGICSILINPGTYYVGNYPNGDYCGPYFSDELTNLIFRKCGNKLFFQGKHYTNYNSVNSTHCLWVTDGNISQKLKVFPSYLYEGRESAMQYWYWSPPVSTDVSFLTNMFYFVAGDDNTGHEVWRSDGTVAGTFLLKDIYAGAGSSAPNDFRTVNGLTYFIAREITNEGNSSRLKLFQTDGTSAGTFPVVNPLDVDPYEIILNQANNNSNKASNAIGSKFLFVGTSTNISGTGLFSVCTTPIAPVVTSSVGSSICVGSSTTLTAAGCSGTINWSTGATTSSIIVSPTVTTTYTATCTDVCGVSPSGSFPITVNPLPTVPSISQTGTKIICPRVSFSLSASGCNGSTITWSNNTVGSSISVNSANTYTATCTNVCGTSTASSPLIVLEAANTQTLSGIASAGLSHASQSLSSTQTVNNGLNVAYQAGNDITLNTNFISDIGSTFNAEIGSACPITDGLVAYYNMDNNVNDQSGNGHNTTFTNTTVTTGRKGNVNGAYSFNGVNQRINLGGWFNMQEFTISMWLNVASTQNNAYAMIVDNNHGGNISWNSQQDNLNTNQYSFGVSGSSGGGGGYSLTANKWEHIVLVKGNGFVKVYKNGEYLSGSSHSGLINYTSTVPSLCLGAYVNNGNYIRYWAGKMDDVKVYNRAISPVEVSYLYAE